MVAPWSSVGRRRRLFGDRASSAPMFRLSTRKIIGCLVILAIVFLTVSFGMVKRLHAREKYHSEPTQHDPTALRKNPPIFNNTIQNVCDVPPGQGEEGPAGIRGLYKIQQALPASSPVSSSSSSSSKPPRLFCMVYTHSNRHELALRSIAETYAPRCDGFMAASNLTDPTLGAFQLPHSGSEEYENMWNKVQAMWFFAYKNYLLDYDWFHIGGDDMYVIPDNLKRLVASSYADDADDKSQKKRPLYLGASIPNSKNLARRFCGGGAGYTLNRYALHLLVRRMLNGECPAETAPDEDVRLGRCLEEAGVKCQDTNDEYGEPGGTIGDEDGSVVGGGEVRYHHLDVQFHASWKPSRHSVWLWEPLQVMHGIRGNQTLLGQISNTSVSFHLDKSIVHSVATDRGIRRYDAILYQQCGPEFQKRVEKAAKGNKEEREVMRKEWNKVSPQSKKKKEKIHEEEEGTK